MSAERLWSCGLPVMAAMTSMPSSANTLVLRDGVVSPETAKTICAAAGWTLLTGIMIAWSFLTLLASFSTALVRNWNVTVVAFDWFPITVAAALLSCFVGPERRVAERNSRNATKMARGLVMEVDTTKQLEAGGVHEGETQSGGDGFAKQLGPAPELLPGVLCKLPSSWSGCKHECIAYVLQSELSAKPMHSQSAHARKAWDKQAIDGLISKTIGPRGWTV